MDLKCQTAVAFLSEMTAEFQMKKYRGWQSYELSWFSR